MRGGLSIILLCTAAIYGCSATPAIDAEALLESRCSSCHSVSIPKGARKSRSQWSECVERMIAKGAKLSVEEKKALVSHLASRYKP